MIIIKEITVLFSLLLLVGCSTPTFTDKENVPVDGKNHLSKQLLRSELSERLDFMPPSNASVVELESILKKVVDTSYNRYSSHKLGDTLNINIENIKYKSGGYNYILRPVNFTISRSDSRMINLRDLDFLESGIETSLRVTYSDNGVLYVNGEKKNRVSLNSKRVVDYHRAEVGSGFITMEYSYNLPQ